MILHLQIKKIPPVTPTAPRAPLSTKLTPHYFLKVIIILLFKTVIFAVCLCRPLAIIV